MCIHSLLWHSTVTHMHTHKAVCACVCVWRQLRISVGLAAGQVHDRLSNLSCAPLFDLFSHTEPLWVNADTQNTHLNSAYQETRTHRACSNTCETGWNFSYTDLIFGDVISQPEILSHFFSAFKHQSLSHTHKHTRMQRSEQVLNCQCDKLVHGPVTWLYQQKWMTRSVQVYV